MSEPKYDSEGIANRDWGLCMFGFLVGMWLGLALGAIAVLQRVHP